MMLYDRLLAKLIAHTDRLMKPVGDEIKTTIDDDDVMMRMMMMRGRRRSTKLDF